MPALTIKDVPEPLAPRRCGNVPACTIARMLGRDLQARFLVQTEFAQVALKKHREGFADLAAQGLARFAAVEMALHPVEPEPVYALARRYDLSAYDACYLWLAGRLKCPLATSDQRLGDAARTHLASLA